MKKAGFLLLLAGCIVFLFSSCQKNRSINDLSYQTYPYETKGTLTLDETDYEVQVSVAKVGDVRLEIQKPEILAGTVFALTDGAVTVQYGDLVECVDDGGYAAETGILLSSRMFSLDAGRLSETGTAEENGIKYTYAVYAAEGGRVTVWYQSGASRPDHLTAELNGHVLSFQFVNES